jgi:hypothetical protein
MKKVSLGLSLFCGLSFLSTTKTSAQTFEIARQLYFEETGTTTYHGEELQPQWFRHIVKWIDTNGDGIPDGKIEWDEFWLFGVRIWSGPVS